MLTHYQLKRIRLPSKPDDTMRRAIFHALADGTRYNIFKYVLKLEEICVTDAANLMNISLSAASQQLKILEQAGLLLHTRHGQLICYRINKENDFISALEHFSI